MPPAFSPRRPFPGLVSILCGAMLAVALPAARANISFIFEPDPETSQDAIDAFAAAGQLWSDRLADNITVRLHIGFSPLAFNIVGQTSVTYYPFGVPTYTDLKAALDARKTSVDDFSAVAHLQSGPAYSRLINHTSDNPDGAGSATVYVDSMNSVGLTLANARALGFAPAVSSDYDGSIAFNSSYPFDFTHESIDGGSFDFVGVAAHEIGHVLGFVSGVDDVDTSGGAFAGSNFTSNMIDLFRFSAESVAAGPGIQDYAADTRDKYFSVDGGETSIAPFSTGTQYGDGRQASHWKDDLGIGIMDPTVGTGEQLNISNTDVRAMDVIGYTLVPEPSAGLLWAFMTIACGLSSRFRMGRPGTRPTTTLAPGEAT